MDIKLYSVQLGSAEFITSEKNAKQHRLHRMGGHKAGKIKLRIVRVCQPHPEIKSSREQIKLFFKIELK